MLSIIIVNYKSETRTISFVKNELCKIQVPHIIVIVNNGANEYSNHLLINDLGAQLIDKKTTDPTNKKFIFVLPSIENIGFARGNNLGVEFSWQHFSITHFLFTNNDIHFINEDVVEKLIDICNAHDEIALIGPKIIGLDGKCQSPEPYYKFWNRYVWRYWLSFFLTNTLKERLLKLNYSQYATEGYHYKIMGSFFICKALDFIGCGMMDSNTFLYAEEIILSERLNSIGKRVYYYPKVSVLHEHGQTMSEHFTKEVSGISQFISECYYYKTYKNVSSLSLFLGKISFYLYLKLRNLIIRL